MDAPNPKKPSKPLNSNIKRISMRTLAESLGVTKTTISLALRGHTSISKATRERVTKLARELNYRPDPAIAAIAAQRWSCGSQERHRVIAFLCNNHTENDISATEANEQTEEPENNKERFLLDVKGKAEELGYKVERFLFADYPAAEALTRVLHARGIRGIIVPAIEDPALTQVMKVDWSKFTAVCCGIGRIRPPLHTVASDTFELTRHVWEVIAKAGHKRIGAALHCHSPTAEDDWHRIGASCAAVRFLGLADSAEIPIHTGDIYNDALLMQWYEKHRPKIIVGFNHSIGEHLERNGVRIPEDVEFVSLNTPRTDTKWSGILDNSQQLARRAVNMLSNEIRDNRWGLPDIPNITHVQHEWNQGTSFRGAPQQGKNRSSLATKSNDTFE